MIWVLLCVTISVGGLSLPFQPLSPIATVWTSDYDVAVESAREAGLPLLIVLEDGQTDANPLFRINSPKAMQILARYRICRLDVDSEEGRRIADGYSATEFPYTLITDTSCENIVFRGAGNFSEGSWNATLADHAGPTLEQQAHTMGQAEQGGALDPLAANQDALDDKAFANSDLPNAQKQAKLRGRPIVAFVTMNGCHFCELMRQRTLDNDQVQATVSRSFESVIVHREADGDWVDQQDIRIYPTTLLIDQSGSVVDRMEGFVTPEEFLGRLQRNQTPMVSTIW